MKTVETAPIVNSATMIAAMTEIKENTVKLGHTIAVVVTLIIAIRARLNSP